MCRGVYHGPTSDPGAKLIEEGDALCALPLGVAGPEGSIGVLNPMGNAPCTA